MQTFKTSKSRENILSRIRKGLSGAALPMPFPDAEKQGNPIYSEGGYEPEETFAAAFIQLGGKFVFCENELEMIQNVAALAQNRAWKQLLCSEPELLKQFEKYSAALVKPASAAAESADACITGCEALVARTGSLLLSSRQNMGRMAPVYFPVHIVVAYTSQVCQDIDSALALLKKKYGSEMPSMINLASGPSRTADIEKTLVVGVHGPGEVFCFLINDI